MRGNFEALGYETSSFMCNFGSLILVYAIYPIYVIIIAIIRAVTKGWKPKIHSKTTKLLQKVFFNQMLTFTEETYMISVVCCFVHFHQSIYTNEILNDYDFYLSVIALLIVVCYPLFILRLRYLKLSTLEDPDYVKCIGVVYNNLELDSIGTSALWQPFLSLSRRLVLGYVLVFLSLRPTFQLLTVNFQALFQVIMLGWLEPFKNYNDDIHEVFNEGYVLFSYYHLACTTDFVDDLVIRDYVGWSMIFFTSCNILVSVIRILFMNMKVMHLYTLRKYNQVKFKKAMKKRLAKKLGSVSILHAI